MNKSRERQHLEELSLLRATSIHIIKDEDYRQSFLDKIDRTIYDLSKRLCMPLSDLSMILNLSSKETLNLINRQNARAIPNLSFLDFVMPPYEG